MKHVSISDAKTQLTKLLPAVEAGERVVITRHGKPVAELVPHAPKTGGLDLDRVPELRKQMGMSEGRIEIPDDFDDPLPDEFWNFDNPNDPLNWKDGEGDG